MSYRNSGKYDPALFCVPPKIGKGESQKLQLNIQAGHYRALGIVGRSGVFPFDDRSDAVRYCLQVGLEQLTKLEPHLINSVMRHANIIIELAKVECFKQKYMEVFTEVQQAVSNYVQMGRPDDLAAARSLVDQVRKQIDAMPDEPDNELRWKIRYRDELDNRFRYLYVGDRAAA